MEYIDRCIMAKLIIIMLAIGLPVGFISYAAGQELEKSDHFKVE